MAKSLRVQALEVYTPQRAQACATLSSDGKIITLKSSTQGAWFRYTLDGTEPTRTRGYVYCGAISVQPGIQVKAIAYKSGMADSEVAAQ